MRELLEVSQSERALYFKQAVARSESIKNPIMMEKDFWVCWALDQIFSNSVLSPHVTFKGGTSLSKCYKMINRFSEDIDLTLSKQYIGITSENDPAGVTTTNQRGKRLEQLTEKVEAKIANHIRPLLIKEFSTSLSNYFKNSDWVLELDKKDKQTLIFHYPSSLEMKTNEYVQTFVKLEFGARGDINPCEQKVISSYVQQFLPELFALPVEIKVTSLVARRTFWEKAALLHAEYFRSPQKSLPERLFRHYYDLVMLDENGLTMEALKDVSLLNDVIQNKIIYFPSKWANYDEAKIGSLRLYPNEIFIDALKQDYSRMTDMFFHSVPDFNKILAEVKRIENTINKNIR